MNRWGQDGGAPMWSVVVHWVRRFWDFLGDAAPRSAPTCVPPVATLYKLQSNLQIAATCAGPGDSQAKLNGECRLAAASPGLGPLNKTGTRPRDLLRPAVACLREFRKL